MGDDIYQAHVFVEWTVFEGLEKWHTWGFQQMS